MKRKYISNTCNLITIQEAKKLKYDHKLISRYSQNLTFNDLGAVLHLIYLKDTYTNINIGFTKQQFFKKLDPTKDFNEVLESIDENISLEDKPEFLIYYNGEDLYYQSDLFNTINDYKLSIFFISHESIIDSGHFGLFIITNKEGIYYDCNGKILYKDYYKKFIQSLRILCKKLRLKFRWEGKPKGIQIWQMNESNKYRMDLIGCCGSWTFYIAEQLLLDLNQGLNKDLVINIKDIEDKIRNKYKNYLTRLILTYQQQIHIILWNKLILGE